jgi:FtsP/CotA-like multicopper oxidase with cupredoxin domain
MERREFLRRGSMAALGLNLNLPEPPQNLTPREPDAKADFALRIAPIAVELTPNYIVSTVGYNGSCPGPVLRMREGQPVTVDVINETDVPELVHWHGLFVPPEVDGSEEEGTPLIPPHGRRRYDFVARPAGTRWYHTHAMAGADLHRGTYTGQFGFLIIEPASNPARYDQEVFLALRDWEPFFTYQEENEEEEEGGIGPYPEKPAVLDKRQNGMEVSSQLYSINDKALFEGEPIRVRQGERVLMHVVNASAIENRRIALPGHQFHIMALDGNPVALPQPVEVLAIGPGERIDAFVEMNQPGIWVLGAVEDNVRNAGLGIVIEYANQRHQPQWVMPSKSKWDYTLFGGAARGPAPENTIEMIIEKVPGGAGGMNSWLINGKPYPHEGEFVLRKDQRCRLIFRNRTDDSHPVHLHRHMFELAEINGKGTSGVLKDTVVVPVYGRTAVDLVADQPGLALFHCHIQHHMDNGFKALFRYA